MLRNHGLNVSYIDCLDRFHPKKNEFKIHKTERNKIGKQKAKKHKTSYLSEKQNTKNQQNFRNGRGPFLKEVIPKPVGLEDVDRTYSRYGIKPEWFVEDLCSLSKPDMILVTSLMTYWAPGVQETIQKIKTVFPDVPVILGGIYATLCFKHAKKYSGADLVIQGASEKKIFQLVEDYTKFSVSLKFNPDDLNTWPLPAYDLQNCINYIPLRTSMGCPFSCGYCASGYLNDNFLQRSCKSVVKEILYWHSNYKVKDFAFYDDALLINSKNHADIIFKDIIDSKIDVNFHTPNALHIREITNETANLMFQAGFKTIRLGLETTMFKNRDELDIKVTEKEFKKAVTILKEAGFRSEQIGAYLLVGLPEQDLKDVEYSIKTVLKSGVTPIPAYYTPIPHTLMWEDAVRVSRYNIKKNPVFTNNAVLPCCGESFSWDMISKIKKMCKGL